MYVYIKSDYLCHHGIKGQKWGVRRYQSYAENPKLSDRQKKNYAKKAATMDKALDNVQNTYERSKKWADNERKNQKVYSDEEIMKKVKRDFGNDGLEGLYLEGYDQTIEGARKFYKDSDSADLKRHEKTMNAAKKIIDHYSNKSIEDITKDDLKIAKELGTYSDYHGYSTVRMSELIKN